MASSKKIVTMICLTLISLAAIGCSSDSNPVATTPVDPVPVDTAPPAVPSDVSVYFADSIGSAIIFWAPSTVDTDLAGYVVERDYYGTTETLGEAAASAASFVDRTPLMGTSTYNVYAVDTSGNESAVSSIELVRTGSHRVPGAIEQ